MIKRWWVNKLLSSLLLLLLTGTVVLNVSCNCEPTNETIPQTVTFTDDNLDADVRRNLGKQPFEEITVDDLASLTVLYFASHSDIIDLSGIEKCINLVELDLSFNQISNISLLSSLTSLILLNIAGNQASDISPLSSLNLDYLYLDKNEIVDISPLSSLTNLLVLTLADNKIIDISTLSSLTSLTELDLGGNQIKDISSLSSLSDLDWLYLDRNEISDISPLVGNNGLGEGDIVQLEDNKLDLSEGSEDMVNIKALQDRGVEVTY
jgi:hypothetical protein